MELWELTDVNADESEVSRGGLCAFVVGWRGGGMCRDKDKMSSKVYA